MKEGPRGCAATTVNSAVSGGLDPNRITHFCWSRYQLELGWFLSL